MLHAIKGICINLQALTTKALIFTVFNCIFTMNSWFDFTLIYGFFTKSYKMQIIILQFYIFKVGDDCYSLE
jgi:hypothetical protein